MGLFLGIILAVLIAMELHPYFSKWVRGGLKLFEKNYGYVEVRMSEAQHERFKAFCADEDEGKKEPSNA